MIKPQEYRCEDRRCWLRAVSTMSAIFPQHVNSEPNVTDPPGWSRWEIALTYRGVTQVMKYRLVCPQHSVLLMIAWSEGSQDDIRTEQATDDYAIKNGGRF